MLKYRTTITALLLFTLVSVAAEEPASTQSQKQQDTLKLIQTLGSEDFAERERAQTELLKIGYPAIDALVQASRTDDPEMRSRIEDLVNRLALQVIATYQPPQIIVPHGTYSTSCPFLLISSNDELEFINKLHVDDVNVEIMHALPSTDSMILYLAPQLGEGLARHLLKAAVSLPIESGQLQIELPVADGGSEDTSPDFWHQQYFNVQRCDLSLSVVCTAVAADGKSKSDILFSANLSKVRPNFSAMNDQDVLASLDKAIDKNDTIRLRELAKEYPARNDQKIRQRLRGLLESNDILLVYWLIRSMAANEDAENFATFRSLLNRDAKKIGIPLEYLRLAIYDSVARYYRASKSENAKKLLLDSELYHRLLTVPSLPFGQGQGEHPISYVIASAFDGQLETLFADLRSRKILTSEDAILLTTATRVRDKGIQAQLITLSKTLSDASIREKLILEMRHFTDDGVEYNAFVKWWAEIVDKVVWNEKTFQYEVAH